MNTLYTLGLLAIMLVLNGCMADDQPTDSVQEANIESSTDPIAVGGQTFATYCTGCHGDNATGNGPVAEALEKTPSNLTLLAQNNGGVFPTERVFRVIDGREEFISHGTRDMPFWGNVWSEQDGVRRTEEEVTREISEVVEYLRSIQQ